MQNCPMRKLLPGTERKLGSWDLRSSKNASKAFISSPKLMKESSGIIETTQARMDEPGDTLYYRHDFSLPCRGSLHGSGVVLGAVVRVLVGPECILRGCLTSLQTSGLWLLPAAATHPLPPTQSPCCLRALLLGLCWCALLVLPYTCPHADICAFVHVCAPVLHVPFSQRWGPGRSGQAALHSSVFRQQCGSLFLVGWRRRFGELGEAEGAPLALWPIVVPVLDLSLISVYTPHRGVHCAYFLGKPPVGVLTPVSPSAPSPHTLVAHVCLSPLDGVLLQLGPPPVL